MRFILRTRLNSSIEVFVHENKVDNYSLTYAMVFMKVCWMDYCLCINYVVRISYCDIKAGFNNLVST